MLAVLAEFERDLVSERTTAALAHKRANRQRTGTVPYGFDLADNGVTLLPNKSEQTVIADIHSMRSRGMKLRQIAGSLARDHIPTKIGRSDAWSVQAVWRILQRSA